MGLIVTIFTFARERGVLFSTFVLKKGAENQPVSLSDDSALAPPRCALSIRHEGC